MNGLAWMTERSDVIFAVYSERKTPFDAKIHKNLVWYELFFFLNVI